MTANILKIDVYSGLTAHLCCICFSFFVCFPVFQINTKMSQIGSLFFSRSPSSSESDQCPSLQKMQTLSDFLDHVR